MQRKMKWILLTTILAVAILSVASVTLALQTRDTASSASVTTARMRLSASASGIKAYSAKEVEGGDAGEFQDEHGKWYKYEQSANTGDALDVLHMPSGASVKIDAEEGGIAVSDFMPGDKVEFDITVTSKSDVSFYYRAELYVDASKGEKLLDNIDFTAGKLHAGAQSEDLAVVRKDIAEAKPSDKEKLAACTDYTAWETFVAGQASIERVHVTIKLPMTAGDDCQHQTVKFYYRAYGEQNTDTLADIAEVGEGENKRTFKTIEDAAAYAVSHPELEALVRVIGNTAFEEGTVRLDSPVKFVGEKVDGKNPVLKGLRLSVRDAATAEFDGIDFAGDSYIDVSDCAALTLKNCAAHVTPGKFFDTTSRTFLSDAAFIVSGASYTATRLTMTDNAITAAGGAAICMRAPLQDRSALSGNTFGAADKACTGTAAIVLGGGAANANISLESNTLYASLPLWLGSEQGTRFRVRSVNNTAHGVTGVFANGNCDGVFLDTGSHKDGEALTVSDVLGTELLVAGVDVAENDVPKIARGKLSLSTRISDEDFGTNYGASLITPNAVELYRDGKLYGYLNTASNEQGFTVDTVA